MPATRSSSRRRRRENPTDGSPSPLRTTTCGRRDQDEEEDVVDALVEQVVALVRLDSGSLIAPNDEKANELSEPLLSSSMDQIPVARLATASPDSRTSYCDEEIAVAYPIHPNQFTPPGGPLQPIPDTARGVPRHYSADAEESSIVTTHDEHDICHRPPLLRPKFLHVQVQRPSSTDGGTSLGLELRTHGSNAETKKGPVHIASIDPSGLLAKTPLQRGDCIVSVNGIPCVPSTAGLVAELLAAKCSETLSLLVQHNGDDCDATLVSSTIIKPTIDAKVGVTLKKSRGRALMIGKVRETGLFGPTSLLEEGHRCISINGVRVDHCAVMAKDACQLIFQARDVVTIVSQPTTASHFNRALVTSCENHSKWWQQVALTVGSIAAIGAAAAAQSFA